MSERYVKASTPRGWRSGFRVALGTMRAEGGPKGARWTLDFIRDTLLHHEDVPEEELEVTPVLRLGEVADMFGVHPQTVRKALREFNLTGEEAACRAHQLRKRCDCKRPILLTLAHVETIWPELERAYHRMARRPGRVRVSNYIGVGI